MIKKLLSLFIFFLTLHVYAIDIYVDQTAPAGGNGSSWATAFQDIESAVNVAIANDRILIAAGIYQPVNELDILVPLTISGGYPSGGGAQNIALHTTQIQADFDPANLLFRVFEISANAACVFTGIRFSNCRRVIDSDSSIIVNNVVFDQISDFTIVLGGTLDYCRIFNSRFSNTNNDVIRGLSLDLQEFEISQTIFESGTERAISLGDGTTNFSMRNCTIRDYNNSTSTVYLDTTIALISNLQAIDNISSSGALVSFVDTDLTMENCTFNNNSGGGDLCIQGRNSELILYQSEFTNNTSISPFASPVLSLRDVELTATECLFENNLGQGSQPDSVAEIRGDNRAPTVIFDTCKFINNVSTGSITTTLDISYGAYAIVRNCVFDGNISDRFNGFRSVNAIGIELTNNIFKNHTSDSPLIDFYDTTSGGYTATLSENLFYDNTFTELDLTRYGNLNMSNNQIIGENIDITISRITNASSSNDYFRGNSNGNEMIVFSEINMDIENNIMVSMANGITHELFRSANNTSLNIVNSTFSSVNLNNTNVTLGFDDDLASSFHNSIVWSGSGNLTQSGLSGTTGNLTINHSLVKGENPAGTGNMNGTIAASAPVFVNPTAFDFRMQRCSPTINQGLNTYSSQTNDYQGNNRVFETTIDLGAYEIQEPFNVTCVTPPVPPCTSLITPSNGDIDVNVNSSISWNPVPEAIGYILQIGSTPGANDIVDTTLGNVTSYSLSNALSFDSQIFVTIIPFNGSGNAVSCTEESFFTLARPNCTNLSLPTNGAVNVAVDTNITWNTVPNVLGYNIAIGTTSGSDNILSTSVGDINSFDIPFDLTANTTYYITISPYNAAGTVTTCAETSFTTEALASVPPCISNIVPTDASIDVAINSVISWNTVATATGYVISIGTAPGFTDILNNFDNGNVPIYVPPTDFLEATTYYVTITPYNTAGNATGCTETSFTTELISTVPPCSSIITPANNAIDISVNTDITWNPSATATGYFISIGTLPGLNDIINNFNNGFSTNFNPAIAFQGGTTYYVTITPYNVAGNATGCAITSFTTEVLATVPGCSNLSSPLDGDINVPVNTILTWDIIASATGYRIRIGTSSGANDILPDTDVGNITSFLPGTNLPYNTTIYVSITPYNASGDAVGCLEEQFNTELNSNTLPCTTIISPADAAIDVPITTDITWNPEPTATGYFISIGTAPGLIDVLNNFDNGNNTTYNPPTTFSVNSTFYVTITPYNAAGNAVNCIETSFTTELLPPGCATIAFPMNNDFNIPVSTNIVWNPTPGATGYFISIGTSPGANDILNNFDNGNSPVYVPPTNFLPNTDYYYTVTPYNASGNATGCAEVRFTTVLIPPICVNVLIPADFAVNVSVATNIEWDVEPVATGYFISIGTAPGLTDVLNNFDNGNSTIYNPPTDFAPNTTYYVTVFPYNAAGTAATCGEFQFTTGSLITAPPCTTIITPADGAIDVAIDTDINWNTSTTATGYFISIGTAPGLTDVLNNFDNGNSTTYNPPADFLEGTTYYVTITPYNAVGNATGCAETSFTTEIIPIAPPCTSIITPADGAIDVAIDTDIDWNTSPTATGYFISIGTAPGLTDVLNNFDNGNSTTYNPPADFLEGTTYYVTITPYNAVGNATGCTETSFTTEIIPTIPPCATIIAPADAAIDVAIDTDIDWNTSPTATGYFISIGTAPGLTDVLNNFDNGNSTTYNPPADFLEGTTYYVIITPYNTVGNATGCAETSFTTEIIPTIPPCATIIAPADGALEVDLNHNINWFFAQGATGYLLSLGTSPGASDLLNNFDNGNNTVWSNTITFPENTTIYVSITPYNLLGEALDCDEFSFTTVNITLDIPQYFTPNQDGFNDLWRVDDPTNEVRRISILDRFGKLLYQSNTAPHIWDGIFNNNPLPSSDYWYVIEMVDGNTVRGHFSLIR